MDSTYKYELTGNAETLNGVETLINDLCQRFGTPDNELGLYVPQRQLMQVLVGLKTVRVGRNQENCLKIWNFQLFYVLLPTKDER